MILRFRIEAENLSKVDLEEELAEWATKFQHLIMQQHIDDLCGKWECTDDVVSKAQDGGGGYKGRIVLKFHLLGNHHEWANADTMKWCRACGKAIPREIQGYPVRMELAEEK